MPDPRLVAAATALAMTDLRRSGKTAPAVLERVLPYYMAAAEVCVSAYLATPAELGTDPERLAEAEEVVYALCDAWDGDMPDEGGLPLHDAWMLSAAYHARYRMGGPDDEASRDPVPDEVREAQDIDVEEWAERMGADG